MLNQFSRTELLLGKENMERLADARVAVFGIGGVGGYTVEALARSGVGTLDMPNTADQFDFSQYDYVVDAIDTVTGKIQLVEQANACGVPIISSMGAGNKLDPSAFEVADIYKTSVCPLAKVMRRELKKRRIRHLKVVYSKEQPLEPIDDMAVSCREHCICPPGAVRKCTERRAIPGSTAFVPSVVGLIIAGEVVKDLTVNRKEKALKQPEATVTGGQE